MRTQLCTLYTYLRVSAPVIEHPSKKSIFYNTLVSDFKSNFDMGTIATCLFVKFGIAHTAAAISFTARSWLPIWQHCTFVCIQVNCFIRHFHSITPPPLIVLQEWFLSLSSKIIMISFRYVVVSVSSHQNKQNLMMEEKLKSVPNGCQLASGRWFMKWIYKSIEIKVQTLFQPETLNIFVIFS